MMFLCAKYCMALPLRLMLKCKEKWQHFSSICFYFKFFVTQLIF